MKQEILVLVGAFLPTILLASPGYADSFSTYMQRSYQEQGKAIVVNQCLLEGSSGQGLTSGILTWQDGVKTRIKGNFSTLKNGLLIAIQPQYWNSQVTHRKILNIA